MIYEIGEVIKEIHKSFPLSVDELASQTGIAASYIYQIEAGEKNPSFDNIQLISKSLNVEISLLILKSLKGDKVSELLLRNYPS